MTDTEQHPRHERTPLRADIDMRRLGEHRYRVNILDLSPEGCKIESPIIVAVGAVIMISLPGLQAIESEVRWVENWTVGVKFRQPLHAAVFDMVRSRMEQLGRSG